MRVLMKFKNIVNTQYSKPKGMLGWFIGEKMIQQHRLETLWTIKSLNVQKNEHILEIGCGAGYALKLILNQNTDTYATGIDISKTLLRSASIRNKKALRKKRIQFVHGSVEKLPFNGNQFSKVFSIHSIYFWDNLSKSLGEIHRVLKPGGSVNITLSDGKNEESWDTIKSLINNELIPIMKQLNFNNVKLLKGPVSRGYHTIAITGFK